MVIFGCIAVASFSMAPAITWLVYFSYKDNFLWHFSSYICKYHHLRCFLRTNTVIHVFSYGLSYKNAGIPNCLGEPTLSTDFKVWIGDDSIKAKQLID